MGLGLEFRPGLGEPCPDCTSRRHKTHITQTEICYPWHPWHGKEVIVHRSVKRWDKTVFHCRLADPACHKKLEVPQWMCDRAACCTMHLAEKPSVGCDHLRNLQSLLRDIAFTDCVAVPENQHPGLLEKADAETKTTETQSGQSTESIPSSSGNSSMAHSGRPGEGTDGSDVGAPDTPTSPPQDRSRRDPGGRR